MAADDYSVKSENPAIDTTDNNIFYLLRIAQGIKVKDLAPKLSITPAYVNAIESGKRLPSNRLLRDYANALNVSVETILSFNPEEQAGKSFRSVLLSVLKMLGDVDE